MREETEDKKEDKEDEMTTRQKLAQIIISSILLFAAFLIERSNPGLKMWQKLLIYLFPYFAAAFDILKEALEGLLEKDPLNEDFLMCIATIGALLVGFVPGGSPQFPEAVFVMLFFQIGELFEGISEEKSTRSISGLLDIRPDTANLFKDGEVKIVDPEELKCGDIIVIKPGEKVPVDGTVIEGSTSVNTVAITGESLPRKAIIGDQILSGCVNLNGLVKVRVDKEFGESTASKILDLVENAGSLKSKSEKFITRFARIYTPLVVLAALVLAFVPPLFVGNFADWLLRALTFLIVSCPCALVVSVPLAFFGGIGKASAEGILVKGGNFLDLLAKTDTVVFDKTGTLTEGVFKVTDLHPDQIDKSELLHLAAHVERYSTHPIALSLKQAYGNENDGCYVSHVEEIAGKGVKAMVQGKEVCVGNSSLMESLGIKWIGCSGSGTIVHVAVDGKYAGHIHISDVEKKDSYEAVKKLKKLGIRNLVMLTGDREDVALSVAKDLDLDGYKAGLLPDGKVNEVEKLLHDKDRKGSLAFVGDGINDAPVLARADVGIAMGAMGSDAAIEAADVVLMDDKPSKIGDAIKIARHTLRIAKENIVLALAVKFAILILAALGLAPMFLAVFGDTGVLIICVLNSARLLTGRSENN